MTSEIKDILENMTTAAPEMEDYIGEDGLLYCGKCHTPKEAYFPEGKELFGRDRHPAECDCQRAAREQRQAAEEHRRHVEAVENLKQRAFADSAMQQWTFENDNGRNPQTGIARRYAEGALGRNAGRKHRLPVLGERRQREKLPCGLYRKRPHGERSPRIYDELRRYPGRPLSRLYRPE